MIIKLLKAKDEETVVLELEDNKKLYLSLEVVMKNGLRKGDELDEDLFNFLIIENQKYFIRKKAIDLIARRPHSAFELKIKLMNRKYDRDLIDSIIKDLIHKNILNDREFAIQYSAERTSLRKIGKQKIKSELIKKGIQNSIIEEVLENIDYVDDYENAVKLAEKKYKSLYNRKTPPEKIKNKIISFLLSKGYDYEIARQSVKKLNFLKKLGDDFDD